MLNEGEPGEAGDEGFDDEGEGVTPSLSAAPKTDPPAAPNRSGERGQGAERAHTSSSSRGAAAHGAATREAAPPTSDAVARLLQMLAEGMQHSDPPTTQPEGPSSNDDAPRDKMPLSALTKPAASGGDAPAQSPQGGVASEIPTDLPPSDQPPGRMEERLEEGASPPRREDSTIAPGDSHSQAHGMAVPQPLVRCSLSVVSITHAVSVTGRDP